MTYWQVAAGEGARDYSDVFLKYGVMLMGSGHRGSFLEFPEKYKGIKGWQRKIVTLAEKVMRGDIVILKKGHGASGRIVAVGRVSGDYEFLPQFDDVEGWDIRHGRKVDWVRPTSQISVDGFSMGTIKRVLKAEVKEKACNLLNEQRSSERPEDMPPPAAQLTDDGLVETLASDGVHWTYTAAIRQAIQQMRVLAGWYIPRMNRISEHEVRTFLIIPLLQALGWSEKQIRIEWGVGQARADTALFREEFTKDTKPYLVLESKRFGMGLHRVERQAIKYAGECNRIVISTGDRYWLFEKGTCQKWDRGAMREKHLRAYMNIFFLKDRHPYLPGVGGAPELLKSLMPG